MIENSGILSWDSEFFGKTVGFVRVGYGQHNQVIKEIEKLKKLGCRLIYIYSKTKIELIGYNSLLVDKKRSYILESPRYKQIMSSTLNFCGKPEDLYNLSYQAGFHSRYRLDSHISINEFKKLYECWINNSINKGFADYVLAVQGQDKYDGFITAKIKNDEISIGLFATDESARGKGIGSLLIQKIINIAAEEKLKVEVTTQADNDTACAFYEHRGFNIYSQEYVYHVWL